MATDISAFAADLPDYSGQPGFSYSDATGLHYQGTDTHGSLIMHMGDTWLDASGIEWRIEFPEAGIPSQVEFSMSSGAKLLKILYKSDGTLTWSYTDGTTPDTDTSTVADQHYFLLVRIGDFFRGQSSQDASSFSDLFTTVAMANDTDVWDLKISDAYGVVNILRVEGFNTNNPAGDFGFPDGATYVSGVNSASGYIIKPPNLPGYVKPVWTFATGVWTDGPTWQMSQIKIRQIRVSLDAPDQVTFSVGGASPEARLVKELRDDLWVNRNGDSIFRGRIMNSSDAGGATYDVTFEAQSYAGMLAHRHIHPIRTSGTKRTTDGITNIQFPIAWTPIQILRWLILHSEGQLGMQLGLKLGAEIASPWLGIPPFSLELDGTPVPADGGFARSPGDSILESINALQSAAATQIDASSTANTRTGLGFDFWIDENLTVHVALIRGKDNSNSTTLDYGGIIGDFTRLQRAEDFGNVVLGTSDDSDVPYGYWVPSAQATTPRGTPIKDTHTAGDSTHSPALIDQHGVGGYTLGVGGWSTTRGFDSQTYAVLQAQTKASYAQASKNPEGNYSFSATFIHGGWEGPDHVWLGDYVTFRAQRGRVNVNQVMRVIAMDIDIDQNGVETVTVQLEYNRDRVAALGRFKAAVQKALKKKQAKKK